MNWKQRLLAYSDDPHGLGPLVVAIIVIVLICVSLATAKTVGEPKYAAPDEMLYYKDMRMPDYPGTPCCEPAEVYYADKTEEGPNGQIIAIITDERPDDRVLPDGTEIHREHLAVGTRVPVPPKKLRKVPIPNPTGHTLIWLGFYGSGMTVYCYEPQALL